MSGSINIDIAKPVLQNKLDKPIKAEHKNNTAINLADLKSYLLNHNISNNYLNNDLMTGFNITLPHGEFTIEKFLRILPNRRLVFLAYDLNSKQQVVIKLFIDSKKYQKDYAGLLQNHNLLNSYSLLTPRIIANTQDQQNKLAYIIFEYLQPDVLPDSSESAQLTHKLFIAAIAKLHKNFIYQKDLHLDNFIIHNKKVYYLDVESLYTKPGFLVNNNASDNFALFLAQLDSQFYPDWNRYTTYYLQCLVTKVNNHADKSDNSKNIEKVIKYINKKAKGLLNQRLNKFLIKTTEDNTLFRTIKSSFNNAAVDKPKDKYTIYGVVKRDYYSGFFSKFLENPSNFIMDRQLAVLKEGNTAHVHLIEFDNKKFIIKHYLPKSFSHQVLTTLKSFLRLPRAINSWCYANLLELVNVTTPSPVGYAICTQRGFIKSSYYIMEYDESYQGLAGFNTDCELNTENCVRVCSQIANLLNALKALKLAHRDFKNVNLGLIGSNQEHLTMLDLDAMKRYKSSFFLNKQHNKDINRLLRCYNDKKEFLNLLRAKITNQD